jgi:RNA polymerase sigma-70 factor (ECF subfamily)
VFATTRWSLIATARPGAPDAREALAALCHVYWGPLYAYIRRRGHSHEQAQDLTQDFFADLLARDSLEGVDPARGRFRSFLLAACRNFLSNQHDREQALKCGGGRRVLSLDFADAERRYAAEPAHEQTPERLFERRRALALLDHVLGRLREEYAGAGKRELFERLKGSIVGAGEAHAQTAAELGMSEVAVHRLRGRCRELLREEIARTVDDAEINDEVRGILRQLPTHKVTARTKELVTNCLNPCRDSANVRAGREPGSERGRNAPGIRLEAQLGTTSTARRE